MMKELKTMSRSMFWRNLLFHFTRNNPKQTEKYYCRFIEIIGIESWKTLDPYYKNSWLVARNSFDKMYGLVAAWKNVENFEIFTVKAPEKSNDEVEAQELSDAIFELTRMISDALTEYRKGKMTGNGEKGQKEEKNILEHIKKDFSQCEKVYGFKKLAETGSEDSDKIAKMKKHLEALYNVYRDIVVMNNTALVMSMQPQKRRMLNNGKKL